MQTYEHGFVTGLGERLTTMTSVRPLVREPTILCSRQCTTRPHALDRRKDTEMIYNLKKQNITTTQNGSTINTVLLGIHRLLNRYDF